MSDQNGEFGAFVFGFLMGGLVGAAVALLMAPQSGEETRTLIRDKSIELKDKATEAADDMRMRAETAAQEARAKAEELAEQARARADELTKQAKDVAEEVRARSQMGKKPPEESQTGEASM